MTSNMSGINGIEAFNEQQKIRENLLLRLLKQFNEGRSKSYYCIAATVLNINELESALTEADIKSQSLDIKDKANANAFSVRCISVEKGISHQA